MPRVTALARSVVPWPWRPALAWAWSASALVLVTAGIAHGWTSGLRGGIAAFVAWAIARELAPARAVASLLAPFAAVAFAIPAQTDVVACAGVLVGARVALRSTGAAPTALDRVLLVALAWWLAHGLTGLPVALVLAAVVWADDRRLRSKVTGGAMLAVAILAGTFEGTLTARPGWDDHALAAQVLLAVAVAAALTLLVWPLPERLRVRDDRGIAHLRGSRLRAARVAVVASALAAVAWTGTDAAFALSSASAAVVAAALGGPGSRRSGSDH